MTDKYWIPFRIQEEGCKTVVRGPYTSCDEAMKTREDMKQKAILLKEYVGPPFIASSKEEAESLAEFF